MFLLRCFLAGGCAHSRRSRGAEAALGDRTADHVSQVLGFAGIRVDRGVPRQAIEVAGEEGGKAILVAKEGTERTSHSRALVEAAFTASTSLRRAEGRAHDRVALPLGELC